jgi:hypothetical protein
MDPLTVEDPRNYSVTTVAEGRRQGRSGGFSQIPLQAAVYDPATQTVTLRPARPLRPSISYQVFLPFNSPQGSSLADASGNRLQEFYSASVERGQTLRIAEGRLATLRLTGGGTLELTQSPTDLARLRVIGAEPGRSVLSGRVRGVRRIGPFFLSSIVSPTAFENRLRPRQFLVGAVRVD